MPHFIVDVKIISPTGAYTIESCDVESHDKFTAEDETRENLEADDETYDYMIIGVRPAPSA
jgi:hypothetical protein